MTGDSEGPSERWRQLIGAFDPERNLRAAADLLSDAASSSERLLHSINGDVAGVERASAVRDLRADFERSFDAFAATAKRLLLGFPFGGAGSDSPSSGARIAVVDGVGTTAVEIPNAEAGVRCTPLLRHDGIVLDAAVVRVVRSQLLDGGPPTFVVRVDVPHTTASGTYHGQLVAEGLADLAVALKVVVVGGEE